MSRDNFKDEFEKSKQPVEPRKTNVEHSENVEEHINDVDNNPVHNEGEEQVFPPRGISRRNRSIERRQKGEPVENKQGQHNDDPIGNEQVESKDEARKRRERSIIASATTVGGSVVGNVKSAHAEEKEIKERKDLFDKEERERKRKEKAAAAAIGTGATGAAPGSAAHASTVKPDPKSTEKVVSKKEPVKEKHVKEKPVKSDDGGSGFKKLIPILAIILILLPLLFLAGKWISNQNNEDNANEVAMTEDKNKASDKEDKAAADKAASDKEDKAAADKEKADKEIAASDKEEKAAADKEKSTEDKATKEDSAEEVTTEAPTAEAPTAEAPTTETPAAAGGTHTVGPSENLYRIAIKYYGSGSPENVEKIRRANGLSGNNVSQGQTLVIPK